MNKNNELVKSKLQRIARKVDEELPSGYGFAVLVFNFGEGKDNEIMYVSNADRQDIVKAMEEQKIHLVMIQESIKLGGNICVDIVMPIFWML